jgi:hypothetical protein
MCGGIKLNGNWRERYNGQLMQLFGQLAVLLFVRTSRLNWIGHVSRTDSKSKVTQVFNNNPQVSRLRGDQKTDGGTVYRQTDRHLNNWKINDLKER